MIPDHLPQPVEIAREVYGAGFPSLHRYVDILGSTGIEWGVLGPREAERLWDRHILNSAALSGLIGSGSVVTGDIPPRVFAAGIPARVIRKL